MKNLVVKKTAIFKIFMVFLVLIASFFIYNLFTATLTLSDLDNEIWDGVEVATSFSGGNGTKENPYQISNGSELAYLKKVVEEETLNNLKDTYFILTKDIDLGGHEWSGIGTLEDNKTITFSGHLNGQGNSIENFKLLSPKIEKEHEYYSLFNFVSDAEIMNLNINNVEIKPTIPSDNNQLVIGLLANEVIENTTIKNISIDNYHLDLSNVLNVKPSKIGGLFSEVRENNTIENIYNNIEITNKNNNIFGSIFGKMNGTSKNIVTEITHTNFTNQNISVAKELMEKAKVENTYQVEYVNGKVNVLTENITIEKILENFNNNTEKPYQWMIKEGRLIIVKETIQAFSTTSEDIPAYFNFGRSAAITLHETGIEGDTVYINDLDSDYNYYKGLNYTSSQTGTLPTGVNQNIYNDTTLAKVYIQYNASDISDSTMTGYISLDEQQSKMNYYKYYPIENGYVNIPLIDNPYADHPNDKAFNGWITDYPGVTISFDEETYTRYAKVPVNSDNTINITFYASWIKANSYIMSSSSWQSAFNAMHDQSMRPIKDTRYEVTADVTQYYVYRTVGMFSSYPSGAVNNRGQSESGTCFSFGGCDYYIKNTDPYNENETYYELRNNRMTEVRDLEATEITETMVPEGASAAALYESVNIPRYSSIAGYYDQSGVLQTSGTCNSYSGCTYYKLQQFYDDNGNANTVTTDRNLYYLPTRDTNIIVLNTSAQASWSSDKPVTITGIYNGRNYHNTSNYINMSGNSISVSADTRIEHILIRSTTRRQSYDSSPSSGNGNIYANYNNLKIGRGITQYSNYVNASAIVGGGTGRTSVGSSSNLQKYKVEVESGVYNNTSSTDPTSTRTIYVDGWMIYGSDYDRVTKNNDNLDIVYAACGSWSNTIYSDSTQTGVALHMVVKSGSFGTNEYDYAAGIYVGGRNDGDYYAAREAIIEGGDIYNLLGGPLTASNRENINDTYINIKGGTIDMVIGGAGRSETFGNRIINMTGGTVNYGVFGGSNGIEGSDSTSNSKGTLTGSTFLYIGGNATVGDDNLINRGQQLYGVSSGNVFGIGNGNSSSTQVGSANHSNIIIDGNATIKSNVYGGGNYGATGLVPYQNQNGTKESTTNIKILGGNVLGSVYGGGNNNGSGGEATYDGGRWGNTYTTTVNSTINIEMTGGTVGNIYGGSRVKGTVYGDSNVTVLAGKVTNNVYGGGEGGYTRQNSPGTYIEDNVNVTIGNETEGPTISGSVYGGSAYGTVNGTGENERANNKSTNVTVNNGVITTSVFGGGQGNNTYTPKVYGNVLVTINNGNIGNVFGGNDAAGSPSNQDTVYLNNGTIGNAFGGGNETGQTTTNIYLQGATVTNSLYGGSNESGNVTTTNVTMTSGNAGNVFGGNNLGGRTTTDNVNISGGTITGSVYGGGNKAPATTTLVNITNSNIGNVFGGSNEANATTTDIKISNATIGNLYGGSNTSGTVDDATIHIASGTITNIYGGNNLAGTTSYANITVDTGEIGSIYGGGNKATSNIASILINNGNINNIFGGGNEAGLNETSIEILEGDIGNVYGGSNKSGDIPTTKIYIGKYETNTLTIDNIFGGNNLGGTTTNSSIDVVTGVIGNIYGGGNEAVVNVPKVNVSNATVNNIYGGGNMATINGDTSVIVTNSTINTNIYGGGNYGEVSGSTKVDITSTNILGSAYGGGNGQSAIVNKNTEITVDGNTVIGSTSSKAPHQGCLFGGGNAAATGTEASNNSTATVNLVGGHIYGNVYGGANTSVVYGKTDTNIGTKAVNKNNLEETSINIGGTVFGGGEANAEGSENYDFSFISVTGAIDIDIDGEGYLNNNHDFIMSGSIFGSGNASSSSGTSDIYIANLGTRENPSENISIQRANKVVIDNTVMELEGTTDRTNEYSDIEYSFNRIDELNIKNNTVLLLQRNANLLQNLKSTVDIDGEEQKAAVIINDDTKKVEKNVDNRIYVLANRNLNVTTNEAATEYGEVSGMTFFGMYQKYGNGSFSYGLYDYDVNYGDAGDAGDIIIGGSYVLGLHKVNHDITVDGFYSNFINDEYTEISTEYINPTPPDSNYYMWTIGISAINYNFAMTASKYSSLGTYELSMREFSSGDTIFEVIGFNSEGLTPGVGLIDSNNVPKVADTKEEANSLLGLSMKTETSEWTAYGTTKFFSDDGGKYTGDKTYKTDSQTLAPSLMFYLYHAKNISLNQELGTVVITMQALTPKNEIEYDVQLITITIDLVAKEYDDGNAYDASITYDKKYEMPAATSVNITNQSQFTAYFDLYAEDTFENIYGRNNENYHALVTDYALPVGTQITMLDYSSQDGVPEYYYYNIDEEEYNRAVTQLQTDNEITYRINKFIKMGSTDEDNTYDEKAENNKYYDDSKERTIEEFIFIFDFKETTTTGNNLNKYMRFELRNSEDRSVITVLGIRQNYMYFNLYDTTNMVLEQTINFDSPNIYPDTLRHISYQTRVSYDQTANRESIINTNYESSSMGLNVTLYDASGNQVSSSQLTGSSFQMDGTSYFADSEGVFRIKLAGKVSNLNKDLYFLTNEVLPAGTYKMVFSLFASSDGLHNSTNLGATTQEVEITVVPSGNAISVTSNDKNKVVDGYTRLNEQETSTSSFEVRLNENLQDPNLRVVIQKRNIDNKDTRAYTEVDFNQIFKNELSRPEALGLTSITPEERYIKNDLKTTENISFEYSDILTSGTYRVIFKLYDGNQIIDEDQEYIIIKK